MASVPSDDRLTALEMSIAHLQHDFEQLNSVVIRQQTLIEALRRELERLETRLPPSEPSPPADPRHERPPHY